MKPHIPFPKTCIEDYVNYRKEVIAEVNISTIRYEFNNDLAASYKLKTKIAEIYSKYNQLIYMQDFYAFSNISSLETFLRDDLELKDYKVKEIIRHEKKHVKKTYELGYLIKGFGCILLKTKNNKLTYAVQTHIDTSNKPITHTDLVTIANAPSKPSGTDRNHI
jgi:hypothetical protein